MAGLEEQLLSIPFVEGGRSMQGVDCWGLVRLYLSARFGIALPAYDGRPEDVCDDVLGEAEGWPEIPVSQARAGDVILMRIMGQVRHVGVVAFPPQMIQTFPETGVECVRYDRQPWSRRVVAVHRPPGL